MKNFFLTIFIITAHLSFSQNLRSYANIATTIPGESVFYDASTYSNATANIARGLAFPRTDLTIFNFVTNNVFIFPTLYDGMIVYNSVAGQTPATGSGIGNQNVEVGFYYFSNPGSNFNTNSGQWIRLDDGDGSFTVSTTEATTNTIVVTDQEHVIRVTGTADGANTSLVLTNFNLNDVKQLRKCIIHEGDTLIMQASSAFDTATNSIVTGNGMMNTLLTNTAADAYTVECYYTKN